MDKYALYAQRLGDTTLVLAQRYCQLVGWAPTLEEEIALANIGLDYLGQGTAWLDLAARREGKGRTADDLAYFRDEREYTNYLLAELENGDFAQTTLRGYFFSLYFTALYQALEKSADEDFRAIAAKSLKEVDYHARHEHEWLIRFAHGTAESRQRLENAWQFLWPYTEELFETLEDGLPDMAAIRGEWRKGIEALAKACELAIPEQVYFQRGGTEGRHTEKLGLLLAEMQSLRRAHPGASW